MTKINYTLGRWINNQKDLYPLTAKTDRGARIQAKQLSKKLNINQYWIEFFRPSDQGKGTIDNG